MFLFHYIFLEPINPNNLSYLSWYLFAYYRNAISHENLMKNGYKFPYTARAKIVNTS